MKLRNRALAGLCAAVGVLGATATGATNLPLEKIGRIYTLSVCGKSSAPGRAHCFAKVVTDARGDELNGKPNLVSRAIPAGLGPLDLHSAYSLGTLPAPGAVPTGPMIAIVDAFGYGNAERDLAVYRAQYGLPACTAANGCFRKLDQNGGTRYPRQDTGWAQETALDLDMVSASCPNCRILLVEANTNSLADLGAAVNTAAQLGAKAISNSYGGPEYSSETSDEQRYFNHPGIAITVSSGDNGYGVEFPSASRFVTAVGGTSLTRSGAGWAESAWSGSGSGCSAYVAKPAWQTDPTCPRRTVADVAAVADPNTGVAVYGPTSRRGSSWMVFGGTSASAPIIAAIYGRNGGTVNYGADPYSHTGALRDITTGKNGTCSTYYCNAGPGYDGPTGLGTPIGTTAF